MVDVAGVGQQGGTAEAGQGSSLSSQQHQITGGHLGEVSEAASDTCSQRGNQRERERETKSDNNKNNLFGMDGMDDIIYCHVN